MFYKVEKNGNWLIGKIVKLPNGETLDENNRENNYGWVWHDNPPQEYIDWLESQDENNI